MKSISCIVLFVLVYSLSIYNYDIHAQSLEERAQEAIDNEAYDQAAMLWHQARNISLKENDFDRYLNVSVLLADNYIADYNFDSCLIVLQKPLSFDYSTHGIDSLWSLAYHLNGIAHFNIYRY
jgi:hypothetical protein